MPAQSSSTPSSRTGPSQPHQEISQGFLHPRDAFNTSSPPRWRNDHDAASLNRDTATTEVPANGVGASRRRSQHRGRSGSRKRRNRAVNGDGNNRSKATWKKLLWVKQSYPDNYTDEDTFLDHFKRNPLLRPYEFWTLVADSTIIVQHLCSVVIFICCFTAIFQERVSPQTVVGIATLCTVFGWVLRDIWRGRENRGEGGLALVSSELGDGNANVKRDVDTVSRSNLDTDTDAAIPSISPPPSAVVGSEHLRSSRSHSRSPSVGSTGASANAPPGIGTRPAESNIPPTPPTSLAPYYMARPSAVSPRMMERLTTVKSAILIYCSLLGLSPILKSLTQSTSSDSIWALSSWLIGINVFTFDYGAGPESKFPASLSTNAALMASTVLASRLPSTTHVFSLTLFSIEVFGLFPVFRRHLRHHSWLGHLWLTTISVICASGGLSMTISGGGWGMGLVGVVLGSIITCLGMGVTSWWLIGLQRYKNEIHGPWDPARPIIRRHWD